MRGGWKRSKKCFGFFPHRRIDEQCVIALTGFALPTACISFRSRESCSDLHCKTKIWKMRAVLQPKTIQKIEPYLPLPGRTVRRPIFRWKRCGEHVLALRAVASPMFSGA
jgi:hypothetical protein